MTSLGIPDALNARAGTTLEINVDLLIGEGGEHGSATRAEGIEKWVSEVV